MRVSGKSLKLRKKFIPISKIKKLKQPVKKLVNMPLYVLYCYSVRINTVKSDHNCNYLLRTV